MRPVPKLDAAAVAKLIADLDHPRFARREAAVKKIEQLGEPVLGALERALAAGPSAEQRQRLTLLAGRIGAAARGPGRTTTLRKLELLEHLGGADAGSLLNALADGEPDAELTREARAVLARLGRK